jgi:hypothetical protein
VRARGLSSGRILDVVGHCLLVFAFLPTVAALPRWLWLEATNPLNRTDPIVLAFVPVRGLILLLNAFAAGFVPGVAAGLFCGLLACGWLAWRGAPAWSRRHAYGAAAGGAAAALMVLGTLALAVVEGRPRLPLGPVAFELASGLVCGLVAAPGVLRLAGRAEHPSQRRT